MMLPPEREPDEVLENRFGDVTWNHELHARMRSIANCTVCHHTEQQGAMKLRPCSDCHNQPSNFEASINPELFMTVEQKKYGGENGPPPMTAFHASCQGCHKAMGDGPVGCRDCHEQKFSGVHGLVEWDHTTHARRMDMTDTHDYDLHPLASEHENCVSCHHQDENAVTEADYRSCDSCHKPVEELGLTIATGIKDHQDVKHGECVNCHVKFNPEQQNVSCTSCHPKMAVDTDYLRPSLEQAIHGRCSSCHNTEIAAGNKKMPELCTDCHKPDASWVNVPGKGFLVWDHERHGEFGGIECETCHHTEHPDAPKVACSACHGGDEFVEMSLQESLEKTCFDCHKKEDVGLTTWESMTAEGLLSGNFKYEEGSRSFWWDHRMHAFDISLACRNCHHNTIKKEGAYVTAKRIGKEWPEDAGNIQACGNCHGEDGPRPGTIAVGTAARSLPDTYRLVCIDCHRKLSAGP